MSDIDHEQRRAKSRRSFFWAVLTSLLSKGGNILLQLLAMPLALAALGDERFGLFGALQTVMWLIYMSDMGIGGGIGRRLTLAVANNDRKEQSRVISSGFFATVSLALICGLVASSILATAPVERLFGEKFRPYSGELLFNLWLAVGIFILMMVLGLFLRLREAFQELHVFNIFGAVGNVAAAILLFVGVREIPEVWYLLAALYGVQLLMWTGNAFAALWRRPWLVPKISSRDGRLVRILFVEGMAYFVAFNVAPVLEREGLRWLVGQVDGPTAVGHFSILAQLGFFIFGFAFMLTAPLAPAITDAFARKDLGWIRSLHRRVVWGGLAAVILLPCGLWLCGPQFVDLWLRRHIPLSSWEFAAYGLFFAFTLWTNAHSILLCACGFLRPVAAIVALECIVVLCLGWIGLTAYDMLGAFLAAAGGMALTSFWLLPMILRNRLRQFSSSPAVPPTSTAEPPQVLLATAETP